VRASGPTDEWPVQLVSRDTKAAALDALEQFAFTLESTDAERKGARVRALRTRLRRQQAPPVVVLEHDTKGAPQGGSPLRPRRLRSR
jgi:hypothetical protein